MRFISFAAVSIAAAVAATPTTAAQAELARLLRHPSVSDEHVVFAYANDIWIVDREGGEANRLTVFQGSESNPHLSPDGEWIAFTGQYDGNMDVYVVPVEGGPPRRLTHHPLPDSAKGWTPDGRVMFSSGRDRAPTPFSRFWTIGLDESFPKPMPVPRVFNGKLDAQGEWFAYQETQPSDIEWRNYRGGQAKPIWLLEMATLQMTKLPWEGSHDTDPVFLNGMVYFLSDKNSTVNIHRYNPGNGSLRQITRHTEFDAKNLEVGGGALVYEHGGYIRVYDPETDRDEAVEITLRGDFPWKRPKWTGVSNLIYSGAISPTGKRALFEARGEIFSVPVENGSVRNLTNSPGSAQRYPAWAPDGRHVAWFSDESGEYRLVIATQDGLEEPRAIEIPNPTFFYNPAFSPDSKKIFFTDEDRALHLVDLETEEVTIVDGDQYAFPVRSLSPVWSPDGKFIAYAKRLDSKMRAVMVYSLETGTIHQVTDGMADAFSPSFDESGDHLYFLASTNVALTTGWLDMSGYDKTVTSGVYMAILNPDAPSPFLPKSDEEEEKVAAPDEDEPDEDEPAEAEAEEPEGQEGEDETDAEAEAEEEAGPSAEEIESKKFGDIGRRILALPVPQRNYTGLFAGPKGVVFYTEASYALGSNGVTLHRYSIEARRGQPFMQGISGAGVSHDRRKLLYNAGGTFGVVNTSGSASVGQGRLNTNAMQMKVDLEEEWRQIFRDAWRFQRDYFYVPNLHGSDWDAVWERWSPLVEHVSHRSDLTHLLDIMGGEIAVGHSFVSGGDTPGAGSVPGGLLGADYTVANGRYRIKKIYCGEKWNPGLRAPLCEPGIDVGEGDYVLAVNGREIDDTMNIYEAFERTANQQTRIHLNGEPTMEGARLVTVVPLTNEVGLRQRQWMEENRKRVDELSDGKLAYMWLPNTGQGGYTNFNRYYFAQQDKHGAIIDERFNGGGSAADYMVDIMARELKGFFNNPVGERKPFTNPQAGIWGPKVLVINEAAGSGGDLLPWLFKEMKIGPMVGTRTWGGLVGIWDYPLLIDGGNMRVPRGGFYNNDGEWDVENIGVAPDIHVDQTPFEVIHGGDPQLERAVQEALRLLEEQGRPEIIPEPEGPIRAKRAKR